jgi:hypothetical protein
MRGQNQFLVTFHPLSQTKETFLFGNLKYFFNFYGSSKKLKVFTASIVYWCYTFALLNLFKWTRTGSFTQSLSAADQGYGLRCEGIFRQMIRSIYVNMKVFPDHKNGTLFSAAKIHVCNAMHSVCVHT